VFASDTSHPTNPELVVVPYGTYKLLH